MYTYVYIHTHKHTYILTYMHSHINTYIHAFMHTCIHAFIHISTGGAGRWDESARLCVRPAANGLCSQKSPV